MTDPNLTIRDLADLAAIESVPLAQRLTGNNTYDILSSGAAIDPDRIAITYLPTGSPDDVPVTYSFRDLIGNITRAANLFASLGVGPDDVVASLLPAVPETHFTIWGAEAAGIACLVNPLLAPHHLAELLNAAHARVAVVPGPDLDPETWAKVKDLPARVPSLTTMLTVGGGAAPAGAIRDFRAELASQPSQSRVFAHRPKADDIAAYFHTGGTTGVPKLARHSHRGQVYSAWVLANHCDIRPGDSVLVGLPLFHNSPVINLGLTPLSVGAGIVLLGPTGYRNPTVIANFWRIVDRFHGTFFVAVPTVFAALLDVSTEGADVRSLRFAVSGGAAAPVDVIRGVEQRTGIKILEGYGLTEATCAAAVNPKDGPCRAGSIGLRLAYEEVKIIELDTAGRSVGRELPSGQIGLIAVRGPNVFPGYVDPERNAGVLLDNGWLNTGDLGRIDAEGYIWVTGRAKDIIVRGGHNIDPSQIEEALQAHDEVIMAAAVGRPDAHAGELPVAYVTLTPGSNLHGEDLRIFVRERIGERAAVPVAVHVVDALPLTAVGKISKPDLRWDATRRVIEEILAGIGGAVARIERREDPERGTVARVRLAVVEAGDRDTQVATVRSALGVFAFSSEVVAEDPG